MRYGREEAAISKPERPTNVRRAGEHLGCYVATPLKRLPSKNGTFNRSSVEGVCFCIAMCVSLWGLFTFCTLTKPANLCWCRIRFIICVLCINCSVVVICVCISVEVIFYLTIYILVFTNAYIYIFVVCPCPSPLTNRKHVTFNKSI